LSAPRSAKAPTTRARVGAKPNGGIDALPANIDAERFVLGSILLDDNRFADVAVALTAADFALEKHRRIFARMKELHERREKIDRVTVANELLRYNELESVDGLSYLVSLDDGLPQLSNIDSYIAILKQKTALRRVLAFGQSMIAHVALGEQAEEILEAATSLLAGFAVSGKMMRIVDIPAVRTCGGTEIEYIREPELPKGAIVALTGDSGSGKSTLATAWARDAYDVPVLFLDRENPLSFIIDRLDRVGFGDCSRLRFWGGWLETSPPLPDAPVVLEWVRSCDPKPLIVVDSLSAFHDGDQNDASEMRRFMQRCRRLTDLGATVVIIHHDGKGETSRDFRGSSDFKAALDLGFHVSNFGATGTLDRLVLRPWKTRIQCGEVVYEYANGRFIRTGEAEARQTVTDQLHAILRLNPGITGSKFEALVAERGLGRNRGRQYLQEGVLSGAIRRKTGAKNMKTYSVAESDEE
jgi:hypothetical protein